MPTRRLFLLLLLVAPLIAIGGVASPAAAVLAAVLLLGAALDWWLAADVGRVDVRREVADKLSLGEWNPVRLLIENGTARDVRLELRDLVPPAFELEGPRTQPHPGWLPQPVPAGGAGTAQYRVRPPARGDYHFGALYLRLAGPLGLVRRQRAIPEAAYQVRVYPSLRQLQRFELQVRRGQLTEAGAIARRVPGASTEFERVREYQPDDEFRRMNWKATARRNRPMVNQFEAERSQNVVVVVDTGRLMASRVDAPGEAVAGAFTVGEAPAGLAKLDHALNAALLLAYVGTLRGDRVGLLAYADDVRRFIPPARGRRAFVAIVQALYNLQAEAVEPDHGLAFQYLASRNLRRSLVVLFTDLVDREASAQLVAHLTRASQHHLTLCVTLADPTVTRPAAARPTDAQSLYEKMVAQRLLGERAAVLAGLTHRGVLCLDTEASSLSPRLIETYLDLKLRGRI
ncbi:MAG TPA: DUF58 domain-containing protein [Chloroflexota bacterium]|nr:DUF58 domain-containing protein [Chloroflexota bacterium]